jgi:hypothetical protein
MARAFRLTVFAALIGGVLLPETGCSSKSESTPNTEFKAPDVPYGRQAGEGGGPSGPGKK